MIFVIGMFTPGLIRGAFRVGSSGLDAILWTIATFAFVLTVGWIAQYLFGSGLGPTISMVLAIVAANTYALIGGK
jgi:p-aminobenzoyl-glutamate transporter AbgT